MPLSNISTIFGTNLWMNKPLDELMVLIYGPFLTKILPAEVQDPEP